MKVNLLHHTPLQICMTAIRTCWGSNSKSDTDPDERCPYCGSENVREIGILFEDYMAGVEDMECDDCKKSWNSGNEDLLGAKDRELVERVVNKYKHGSTAEHLAYTFNIEGISRACLIELSRHRIASLSVKSTRYVLAKELKNENPFYPAHDYKRAGKYIVLTGNVDVDIASIHALDKLRLLLQKNISNDMAKFALPEALKTSLVWTINARSLQNFLKLRTSKSALWEIRRLAFMVFDAIPDEHKFLFEDFVEMGGADDRKNS